MFPEKARFTAKEIISKYYIVDSDKSSWYLKKIKIEKTFSHKASFFCNISMRDLPELSNRGRTKNECAKIRRSSGNTASVSCKNWRHTPILPVISFVPCVVHTRTNL